MLLMREQRRVDGQRLWIHVGWWGGWGRMLAYC